MVVIKLSVTKGVEARPDWILQCQAAVVQFSHLEEQEDKDGERRNELLVLRCLVVLEINKNFCLFNT